MAKKKINKTNKKEATSGVVPEAKIDWSESHNLLVDEIEALKRRIDRIVSAIGKAKSIKGL